MRVDLFDFHLPDELIALRPAQPRDSARQLIVNPNVPVDRFVDSTVRDLTKILRAGDVLVFNNTRVIPSRLYGIIGEAKTEVLLHKRTGAMSWQAFMKNGRRGKIGKKIIFSDQLSAEITDKYDDGQVHLSMILSTSTPIEAAIAQHGELPLPPYIASKRKVDVQDDRDYQTIYAVHDGAVAAPTAGLHFTPELIAKLDQMGVQQTYVTLHVGAGTFLPVKAEDTNDHKMHAEWGEVTSDTVNILKQAKENGGRIIAVGTTSLRLLESAARTSGCLEPFSGDTDIFITPGFKFKVVDMLMTNFHLPKSTLFMLVSAFAGYDVMRDAYSHAIKEKYRFYSYGDSSLLFRE
jgi:S-adenosylmethionine:tRNA ribosyltransferase-isomerase